MSDGERSEARRGKKRGPKARFGEVFPVKLTRGQWTRLKALNGRMPGMSRSDVIRSLIDMALPQAEERPAALVEATAARVSA